MPCPKILHSWQSLSPFKKSVKTGRTAIKMVGGLLAKIIFGQRTDEIDFLKASKYVM